MWQPGKIHQTLQRINPVEQLNNDEKLTKNWVSLKIVNLLAKPAEKTH